MVERFELGLPSRRRRGGFIYLKMSHFRGHFWHAAVRGGYVWVADAMFPLAPALSLRERGYRLWRGLGWLRPGTGCGPVWFRLRRPEDIAPYLVDASVGAGGKSGCRPPGRA